jgi:hypothetical protein
MASSMRDAADKATWSQMAKRWLAYAEYYEDRRSAFGTRAECRRRVTVSGDPVGGEHLLTYRDHCERVLILATR